MALTDHSPLFASVHEDGINRIVQHIMLQRPSLFHHATAAFLDPDMFHLLCERIRAAKTVTDAGNPLFTVQPPLPILGSPIPLGLNWCFQLTELQIDFHPGNVIALPPQLGLLPAQRFSLVAKACFGLDCPGDKNTKGILHQVEAATTTVVKQPQAGGKDERHEPDRPKDPVPVTVLPHGKLLCFCMKLFVVGHFEWGPMGGTPGEWLKVRLDGLEIVDIGPEPLESAIECYLTNVLRLGVLPRLSIPLEALVLDVTRTIRQVGLTIGEAVSLQPTPVSATVPNNPAVENDQLKAFIDLVIVP